ncbi:MAG TPA: glycosyltransferase family 4 protein [Bryobacteraceae bacterium]|jgi:glycosyltransferase involved in cell wall biosynthesis|nr:glycosyltransferase family 4 protein [Bryobacteraceae bacterium]
MGRLERFRGGLMKGRKNPHPLTILSVAYPMMTIGRGEAGGSEEILRMIDARLTSSGHRSIVIAGAGSQIAGELVSTPAVNGRLSDEIRAVAQTQQLEAIRAVLAREPVDLLHFHGLDFLTYRPQSSTVPQLATLHLPVSWYPRDLFQFENIMLNFVSENQARSAPTRHAMPVVTNGVDLEAFFVTQKRGYILWMGRVCPEKGAHIAARVAHRLDRELIIAGPLHPFSSHLEYFTTEIESRLDEKRRYIGPVNGFQKSILLSQAGCLLVPSLVEETSSLVAMEAIASGTPVVAFRSGALPEVVDHGITGYIVNSEDEMAEAVALAGRIDPEACRRVAEERFSSRTMTDKYLHLYASIIDAPVRAGDE